MSVWQLLATSTIIAGITFYLWWHSYQKKHRYCLLTVVAFAVIFRVLGIGASPILEDDVYRFLWDGRQVIEIGTPYLTAPSEHFTDNTLSDRWHDVLGSINHAEIRTVYGPTAQWSFALAYLIAPGEIWPLQLIYAIVDLLLILLLSRLTQARNVLLYAWSPLVIKEFAFTAHPDVVGAFFMVLGFVLLKRSHSWAAGISLALAVGVKIFAFIAVPLLLVFSWRAWAGFIAGATIVALPFGLLTAWLPDGLAAMGGDWTFNAPLYLSIIGTAPLYLIKLVMAALLGLLCLFLFWQEANAPERYSSGTINRVSLVFAALYLCAPVLNPWYLIWLLAFATIKPTLWAWLASISVLLAYVSGINLPNSNLALYQQPLWLVWAEFIVVIAAFCWAKRRQTRN